MLVLRPGHWRVTRLLFSVLLLTTPIAAAAENIFDRINSGASRAAQKVYGTSTPTANFAGSVINIINILLTFLGIIFLAIMLYAGYLWMTARGNDEQVQRAKKIFREVIVGIIIIILARLFTEFLLTQAGLASA